MRRSSRGAVLLMTLAVMAGLVTLVALMAESNTQAAQAEANRLEVRRAEQLAISGVERAVAALESQSSGRATLRDEWATLGEAGNVEYEVGSDGFRIQILDLGARVDLNTADEATLKTLPLSEEQVASLLDWREATPTARPNGAKDDYYGRLPNPYRTKGKALGDFGELILVRGFTPETLFTNQGAARLSRPSNLRLCDVASVDARSGDLNPQGKAKLDLNSVTLLQFQAMRMPPDVANALIQARGGGFKSMGDALKTNSMTSLAAHILLDNTQIGGDPEHLGRINVNTASEDVLKTLPGLPPDVVSAIISRRGSGYSGLGDLIDVPGMNLPLFAGVVDRLCIGSRAFEVLVVGRAGRMMHAVDAVLSLDESGVVRIKEMKSESFWQVRKWWVLPARPEKSVAIGGTS